MIFFETALQARAFLLLLYTGFGAGLLYDLLSLPRRRWPVLTPFLDVLWCLTVTAACALALAVSGEKQARVYALLGLVCGGAIYSLGLRALVLGVFRWLRKKWSGENAGNQSAAQ